MHDMRQRISSLALKLQSQTHLPLWALAQENLIYSVAVGVKPAWGPRARFVLRVMRLAHKIHAADIVLLCVGLYQSVFIWWTVKKATFRTRESKAFKRIFVGFGASSEEYLYTDYLSQSQVPSLRISEATHEGVRELGCPSLLSVIYVLARNAIGYSAKLKKATHEVSSNAVDFLVACSLNIGTYAFYRSYWRIAKSRGVDEVTFLVMSVPALACVDEGLRTVYLQHGLIPLSILIPKVNRIVTLTSDEECYLRASLKEVQILRTAKGGRDNSCKKNILLLLSPNVFIEERSIIFEPLVQWATRAGLQVVIRPTPNVTKDGLADLHRRFPNSLLDDLTIPLHVSLEAWVPKFVASWTSTGLAVALDYGCLPISLCDPLVNDATWNMIYPMQNRVLFWPRDEALMEDAIKSDDLYYAQLMNLCSYQDQCLISIQ